jgi:hypothetical protein
VAERGFVVDLERPTDVASWSGAWKVSIIDETKEQQGDAATLQIYVFSDIGADFDKLPALQRGESTDIEVRLKLPKGVKAADVIKASEAEVRLRNPVTGSDESVSLEGKAGGPFTGTVDTAMDVTTNMMEATAVVRIETRSGATLVSQSAPSEVLVRRPEGSIQFAPGSLKMPSLTGEGSSEIELVLLGGDKAGCVWFGKATVPDPPQGAGPIEVTMGGDPLPGAKQCIPVPAKKPTTILIEATPSGRASGTVTGTLEVFEKVQGADEASTTEIPLRFDMARGVDEAQRLVLTVVLLIAGLGLPLVALLIINAIAARFQVLDAVRGAAIRVRVKGPTVQRIDGSFPKPLSLKSDDFDSLAAAGGNRRFTFGGVVFRARASRNPFGATIALAAPEGGAEKLKGGEGSRVELDPSLAGSWIFLLDSERTRRAPKGDVDGLLIAFVAEGDIATQTNRMLPDISKRLPSTASSLAGLVRETRRKAPSKRQQKAAADAAAAPAEDAGADDEVSPTPDDGPAADTGVADVPTERDAPTQAADEVSGDVDATDEADPEVDTEGDDPPAPAAPTGFGGATVAAPQPSPAPSRDPGDDEPGGPPAGFSGRRPDA